MQTKKDLYLTIDVNVPYTDEDSIYLERMAQTANNYFDKYRTEQDNTIRISLETRIKYEGK